MTMIETTITCPSWCTVDHDEERAGWLQAAEQTHNYISSPENLPEMRYAFGPDFAPPAVMAPAMLDEQPVHQMEIGSIHVRGRENGMVPVRVVLDQYGDEDEPAQVTILATPGAFFEDGYLPAQARALAALLVEGANVLERAGR